MMRRTHHTKMDILTFAYLMLAISLIASTLAFIGNVLSTHREMQERSRQNKPK